MTRPPVAAFCLLMKLGLLALLVFGVAACGAYQFPGGPPSPTAEVGTVTGHVLAVPCAPVEQPGKTCAGRPVPNLEIDFLAGARVAAKTVTNAAGSYAVALEPGAYSVRLQTYMRVINGPLQLDVSAGSNTTANYILDSGIRYPVPQQ